LEEKKEEGYDNFAELGRSGLKQFSGYIYEEELRPLLSYSMRHKTYKQMAETDSVIGAVLYEIEMFIRRAEWRVQAATDDKEGEDNKLFLEGCKDDLSDSWDDTVAEIINGVLVHGFGYFEIVYKYRSGASSEPSKRSKYNDGKIGWRKFAVRDQESLLNWDFDEDGSLRGMNQSAAPDYIRRYIPIEKSLLFRTTLRKGNPEGMSLLKKAYISWYRKSRIETIESIGIERDLAGLPVIFVPEEWTDANAPAGLKAALANAKKIAVNIKRDEQEGVVFPSKFDENGNRTLELSLLTSGGKRNFDTNQIIQRFDQRIAMTLLAQFLLLGSNSVGSFALSSSHSDLFANAIGTLLKMVASVINRHAVPRLFELNGRSLENLPQYVPGDIETPDLKELGEYIKALSGSGIDLSNDHELDNYLREAASFPLKPDEDPDEDDNLEVKAEEAEKEETVVEAVKGLVKKIEEAI